MVKWYLIYSIFADCDLLRLLVVNLRTTACVFCSNNSFIFYILFISLYFVSVDLS